VRPWLAPHRRGRGRVKDVCSRAYGLGNWPFQDWLSLRRVSENGGGVGCNGSRIRSGVQRPRQSAAKLIGPIRRPRSIFASRASGVCLWFRPSSSLTLRNLPNKIQKIIASLGNDLNSVQASSRYHTEPPPPVKLSSNLQATVGNKKPLPRCVSTQPRGYKLPGKLATHHPYSQNPNPIFMYLMS
jgi:hypothetical protein